MVTKPVKIKLTIAGLLLLIGLVLTAFVHSMTQPRLMTDSELKINGAYPFQQPRSFDPIEFLNQDGQVFGSQHFLGKWSLVFFGYSSCPDICPSTLSLLNRFYQLMEQKSEVDDLQVILVTVDPVRDTPEKLNAYLAAFNPKFMALTGDFLDLQRFANQLNTPFQTRPLAPGKQLHANHVHHRLVDHGANLALINPQGHYVGFFKSPLELSKLVASYRSMVRRG